MVGQTHEVHLFLGAGSQALQHLFEDRNQATLKKEVESFVTVLLSQIITLILCQGNDQSGYYIFLLYILLYLIHLLH